jgi:hypothetical protein
MEEEKKLVLPKRIRGKHMASFKDYKIETNYYKVGISQSIEEIYIYKITFEPFLPADNTKQRIALLEKAMP